MNIYIIYCCFATVTVSGDWYYNLKPHESGNDKRSEVTTQDDEEKEDKIECRLLIVLFIDGIKYKQDDTVTQIMGIYIYYFCSDVHINICLNGY